MKRTKVVSLILAVLMILSVSWTTLISVSAAVTIPTGSKEPKTLPNGTEFALSAIVDYTSSATKLYTTVDGTAEYSGSSNPSRSSAGFKTWCNAGANFPVAWTPVTPADPMNGVPLGVMIRVSSATASRTIGVNLIFTYKSGGQTYQFKTGANKTGTGISDAASAYYSCKTASTSPSWTKVNQDNNLTVYQGYSQYLYIPLDHFFCYGTGTYNQLAASTTLADFVKSADDLKNIVRLGIASAWADYAIVTDVDWVYPANDIISAAPSLGSDISLNITARAPEGKTVQMKFQRAGQSDVTVDGTWNATDAVYEFTYDGILPQHVNDDITMTLLVGGVSKCVRNYSIADYCVKALENENTPETLKKLLVDILYYGTDAQKHLNYKTDNLAADVLTAKQKSFKSGTVTAASVSGVKALSAGTDTSYAWKEAALRLESSLCLRISFTAPTVTGLKVTGTINGRSCEISDFRKEEGKADQYYFYFNNIGASELGSAIEFKFNAPNTDVLTYSVNDYIKSVLSDSSFDAETKQMVSDIYQYGVTATGFKSTYASSLTVTGSYNVVYSELTSEVYSTTATNTTIGRTQYEVETFITAYAAANGVTLTKGGSADGTSIVIRRDSDTSYTGYDVYTESNNIVISTYSNYGLAQAFKKLTEIGTKIYKGAKYSVELGGDPNGLPKFVGGSATVGYVNSGDFVVLVTGALESNCTNYRNSLVNAGYTLYTTNEIGTSKFYTYRMGTTGQTVHVTYSGAKSTCRIVVTQPDEFVPSTAKPDAPAGIVSPTLTTVARTGASISSAPGNSYVYQLTDGTFIVQDGGPTNDEDMKHLYNFLCEHKLPGQSKPVVSLWMFSHVDGDHIDLAINFFKTYHNQVDIRMVALNFPDFDACRVYNVGNANYKTDAILYSLTKYYPNLDVWNIHTGDKMWFDNVEVEILYTPEEHFPDKMPWGNNTGSVWRFNQLGDETIVFLGDAETELNNYMAACYGSAMKADFLQVSHHGFNGGVKALYELVDPKVCFVSCDSFRYEYDSRIYGLTGSTADGAPDSVTWTKSGGSTVTILNKVDSYTCAASQLATEMAKTDGYVRKVTALKDGNYTITRFTVVLANHQTANTYKQNGSYDFNYYLQFTQWNRDGLKGNRTFISVDPVKDDIITFNVDYGSMVRMPWTEIFE